MFSDTASGAIARGYTCVKKSVDSFVFERLCEKNDFGFTVTLTDILTKLGQKIRGQMQTHT